MRVLLSTIGSRGEVQPLVALASQLQGLGHQVRTCVPPDFTDWLEGMGIPAVPLGPRLRSTAAPATPGAPTRFTPERRRQLIEGTVAAQFATVPPAAQGCDIVVGCGALQVAARSAAELCGVGYVHAHFCPVTLPSPHHAPPPLPGWAVAGATDNRERWAADARRWDDIWGPALNAQRATLGLVAVEDVRRHLFTDRPWLAADPALGPWPEPDDPSVVQTGAWVLPDERPLPAELTAFLGNGEPPVYFGLGSMRAPGADVSAVMVRAARALGRRAVVSRGWADLPPADDGPDCIMIDEVNHQALFPRVAAVAHHGGAGTTTAAAQAGAPQVVIPQHYDQFYWAERIDTLGVGTAHAAGMPSADSLATALERALRPAVTERAAVLAPAVRTDGALVAAERLTDHPPSTVG